MAKFVRVRGILTTALVVLLPTLSRAAEATFDYQDPLHPERAARLWLPEGVARVHGVIVWGNAGTGDSRPSVYNPALQTWARNRGFAVLCTKAISFDSAQLVLDALSRFAATANHPELATAPFVALGHSNGGLVALGLAFVAPHRTIAFAMNKAGVFVPNMPLASLQVPAILVAGEFDLQRRTGPLAQMFSHYRAKGALWAFVKEQSTGHGGRESRAMDLIMPFLDRAIERRLVKRPDASAALVPIGESEGWLAEVKAFRGKLCPISPWRQYKKKRREAAWLLDEHVATLFRSIATYDRPLRLTVGKDVASDEEEGPAASVVASGEPLTLSLETFAADEHWSRFVWLDGATELAQTVAPEVVKGGVPVGAPPRFVVRLGPGVHGLTVVAERRDGFVTVVAPVRIFVSGGGGDLVEPQPHQPSILLEPSALTVNEADPATFVVRAQGGGNLRYQWFRNDNPVEAATHPRLRLSNLSREMNGSVFSVEVSNEVGSVRSSSAVLHINPFAGAEAAYADKPPVIDGVEDRVWSRAKVYTLSHVIAGGASSGTAASFRVLWDHEAIYVRIEVRDDELYGGATNPWSNDTAEVFLEPTNAKNPRWRGSGFQFASPYGSERIVEAFSGKVPAGTRSAQQLLSSTPGYAVEYRFPESGLGISLMQDATLGFEVQVNDSNAHGVRRVKLAWHCRENHAFEGPQNIGSLKLVKSHHLAALRTPWRRQ